jgi:hypothetical protein
MKLSTVSSGRFPSCWLNMTVECRDDSLSISFDIQDVPPKCTIFSAERNYAKPRSLFDNLFTLVPITYDHTFAPCNPVAKTSTKVSGEISFTNFRGSARSFSVVWKQEPGSSRFKQRKREKSDGAISREYREFWTNLTSFCNTKSRTTLAV